MYLHNPTTNYWELLSKTNLVEPKPWTFGEILYADGSQNPLPFTPLPDNIPPANFFRAVSGDTAVSIIPDPYFGFCQEPCSPSDSPHPAIFDISISPTVSHDLTVVYNITGSAINGLDYTNISNTVTITNGASQAQIFIQPLYDTNLDFEESVTLTLVLTNGYLVSPGNYTATMWINDCVSNLFVAVATNVPSPIGLDYLPTSNSLVMSYNMLSGGGGEPYNFALLTTNNLLIPWSGVHGAPDEVKVATVKRTANGFTNGDMFFGSDHNVGWVSGLGTQSNLVFSTLTNATVTNAQYLRGSLYVDQTGTWSNNLIAVTSDSVPTTDPKGVWEVDSLGHPTLIANIGTAHLEGVVTITNDPTKWGPWAGRIITGDENEHLVWAIDTNGIPVPYALGIDPEHFDIIPPNQDLYCIDFNLDQSSILKLSRSNLTNYVGDLLVTQAGEYIPPERTAELFIVHWDWGTTNFVVRRISYYRPDGSPGHFEHVTFAPINIPPL